MSDGKSYRCHHGDYNEQAPLVFADILTGYLQECIDNGNKPATICKKKEPVLFFLCAVEHYSIIKLVFLHKIKSLNRMIGKLDESLGRKATGPVKWQPVV